MRAKWRAIIGRHQATQSPAERSKLFHNQLVSDSEPRRAMGRYLVRIEGSGVQIPSAPPRGLHVSVRPIFTFASDILAPFSQVSPKREDLTEFLQVRLSVRFSGSQLRSHCSGGQVAEFRYGWGFAPWLRRRRHLLRPPGRLPGQRPAQALRRALARGALARRHAASLTPGSCAGTGRDCGTHDGGTGPGGRCVYGLADRAGLREGKRCLLLSAIVLAP